MNARGLTLSFLAATALTLSSGCASTMMQTVQRSSGPPPEQAMVTFVRPSSFGGAIQFSLWDGERFIGILSANTNVSYLAQPGEHVFLARAENWSYVKADLTAGRRYLILGAVFPGIWKARVALEPVKKGSNTTPAEVEKWLSGTTPKDVITEKVDDFVKPRETEVREAVEEYKAGKAKFKTLEAGDSL